MQRTILLAGLAAMGALACAPVSASDELATFRTLRGSEVSFSLAGTYSNATLTVTGPNGFVARSFSKTGNPTIDLVRAKASDGVYTYEITAATSETVAIQETENNGRGVADRGTMKVGVTTSGTFVVRGGMVIDTSGEVEKAQ